MAHLQAEGSARTDAVDVVPRPPERARSPLLAVAVAAVLLAALVLRLWPRSTLWLDEAQSVAFARLPLTDIPHALRTDGAPPLYYLLLHLWIGLFGHSDVAVRSLSILISLVTLPFIAVAARRLGGPRAMWPAVVLLAANPFAIRYATETRMYALVVFEVTLGLIALSAALRRATPARLAAVAVLAAALLYTHYWALYLLAATGIVLAATAWLGRGTPDGRLRLGALAALAAGGVLWLPWLPSFVFQARHTATPWTRPPEAWRVFDVLNVHAGGHNGLGMVLACLLGVLMALALVGRPLEPWATRLGWPPDSMAVRLFAVYWLTSALAVAGGKLSGSAYASRYSSVIFPLVIVLAAMGIARIGRPDARVVLVALACVLGLPLAAREAATPRSPASTFANYLEAYSRPGDVVVYCPDQLGPALTRRLEGTPAGQLDQGTFPLWRWPGRVNWVDYARVHQSTSATTFAAETVLRAGRGTIWLVWSPLYPPTQPACTTLRAALALLRPTEQVLVPDRPDRYLDHGGLLRYPAPPPNPVNS